jgi:hypothetical protein
VTHLLWRFSIRARSKWCSASRRCSSSSWRATELVSVARYSSSVAIRRVQVFVAAFMSVIIRIQWGRATGFNGAASMTLVCGPNQGLTGLGSRHCIDVQILPNRVITSGVTTSSHDTQPDLPAAESDCPEVRRLHSDIRELQRELSASRAELRELRDSDRRLERELERLRRASQASLPQIVSDEYTPPVVVQARVSRRVAVSGVVGVVLALAAALPQLLDALGLTRSPTPAVVSDTDTDEP